MQVDQHLDVQGLKCPLPILRTKKTLAQMITGQILHVMATDPASVDDFSAFARQTGNALVDQQTANGVFEFWLQRK